MLGAMTDTASAPRTARERARLELTAEIKAVARRHLAEEGAVALSLRAVARELGMASSAVYRYFPSRDDLVTALIVDAYDAVGEQAEASVVPGASVVERWVALTAAVRSWARANPHEYALIYGSPIPGYRAPADTILPAGRVAQVLLDLLRDGVAAGELHGRPADGRSDGRSERLSDDPELPAVLVDDLAAIRDAVCPGVPDSVLARGLGIWTQMFGAISFELFGHLHNVIHDDDALFTLQMTRAGDHLVAGSTPDVVAG
jgi:AcrR family transcriptional regulator